jgi:UDP-N-acetylmuramoylalanine--D-glutamate ligase
LLAPGCASKDMYTDYAARGHAFVRAIRELASGPGQTGGTA